MAPRIEATYREIEKLIGARFAAEFYAALDELSAALASRAAVDSE
jgi:hypothetical protein